MTVNLEDVQEQREILEGFVLEDKVRINVMEATNQDLERALKDVKQKLKDIQEEHNQKPE